MSNTLCTGLLLVAVSAGLNACQRYSTADGLTTTSPTGEDSPDTKASQGEKMKVTIGKANFTATLDANPTTARLKELLPLTLNMSELNGNEKYFHLKSDLPTNASNPGTIKSGDLMLYGRNSLVLFYETFETSYSYTRLGRLDHLAGLPQAVGTGDVTVTFELE
jgi:hypothetical protein